MQKGLMATFAITKLLLYICIIAMPLVSASPPGYGVSTPYRTGITDPFEAGNIIDHGTSENSNSRIDATAPTKTGPDTKDNLDDKKPLDTLSSPNSEKPINSNDASNQNTDTAKKESAGASQTNLRDHRDSPNSDGNNAAKYKSQESEPPILSYSSNLTKERSLASDLAKLQNGPEEHERNKNTDRFIIFFLSIIFSLFFFIVFCIYPTTLANKPFNVCNHKTSNDENHSSES